MGELVSILIDQKTIMDFLKGKQRDDDLVLLAQFDNPPAAHNVRLLLEAHSIDATVQNEESSAVLGGSIFGQIGLFKVELFVLRSDYADAKMVMEQVPAAAEILIPEWNCQCGETVDAGFAVCWSCGEPHPEESES